MKRSIRNMFVAMMLIMAMVVSFSGCGPKKPTADDAKNYVQAVLDVMCTGDYDHSVEISDIEEGKETEIRDEAIDEIIDQLGAQSSLNEENKAGLKEFLISAFAKAKYSVGDAVESEDGGYDVTVTIEPLQAFAAMGDGFQERLLEKVQEDPNAYLAMSQDEQMNYLMSLAIGWLNEDLENPSYDDPVDVVVHYGLLDEEKNLYGCTESEGKKLGEKLFSLTGM